MSKALKNSLIFLALGISLLMHWEHLDKDLISIHAWRQTQTQATTLSFYEEDMNILRPRRDERGNGEGVFRMEFPLFQWLNALVLKVFGKDIVVTRVFVFLIGSGTVIGMYRFLQLLFDNRRLAIAGAWAFTFSPSFFYYTINPLPDNLALCCGVWGLGLFLLWQKERQDWGLSLFSGLLLGLGALCKLPFILYFVLPFTGLIQGLLRQNLCRRDVWALISLHLFALLPFAWYAWVIPSWSGNPIVEGMLGHSGDWETLLDYWQHNLISTLPELLLNYGATPFFLFGIYQAYKRRAYQHVNFPMLMMLGLAVLGYYLFEANAIGKVHDYYLFPFYPLLFALVAYGAYRMLSAKARWANYLAFGLLLLLPITCNLRMQSRWNEQAPGFNRDWLVHKEALRQAVPEDELVVAGNDKSHFIFFYYIGKKGWGFHNDDLPPERLQAAAKAGARYLYTDSERVIAAPASQLLLDSLVVQLGSVRVYQLKVPVPGLPDGDGR